MGFRECDMLLFEVLLRKTKLSNEKQLLDEKFKTRRWSTACLVKKKFYATFEHNLTGTYEFDNIITELVRFFTSGTRTLGFVTFSEN